LIAVITALARIDDPVAAALHQTETRATVPRKVIAVVALLVTWMPRGETGPQDAITATSDATLIGAFVTIG
tara:strand:- start:340 stop:552 length:213 start_codon:yes stop_codon:yes gene_type:complete